MKEKIYIKDFTRILNAHKCALLKIMGISILSFIALSFILPKTYKSEFELNINPRYFKNALTADVIPEISSSTEMVQTVDSMIKQIMNDDFIDSIGQQYKIYPANMEIYQLARERKELRERFSAYSTGGQTYRISFVYSNPEVTFLVTKKVMATIRENFINTRLGIIELAKRTIIEKLESVNVTKQIKNNEISDNALASKNINVLNAEMSQIKNDLAALKMQFNDEHPRVAKLIQRKTMIQNWLKEGGQDKGSEGESPDAPVMVSEDKSVSENITSRLYTKFNDINIALDIERKSLASYLGAIEQPQAPISPLFPKKRLFALLGLMIGFILCFVYVFYKEVLSLNSFEESKALAQELGGPFFGVLQHIDEKSLMSGRVIIIKDGLQLIGKEENSKSITGKGSFDLPATQIAES